MVDRIDVAPQNVKPRSRDSFDRDVAGTITRVIGSGKHAQAAIVWQTIKWSFLAGSTLTVLVFIGSYFDPKLNFEISSIATIWSIFVPIITLALGYIFGKGKE
ncbi:hypothetical protein [Geopsychrobacter electrodiphilus]|uniref:hypothetical protein n=1 Tax=Geopsychrobacter electrodiphilus TaxID=225196 RepID=UPI00037F0C60|nr:hypothetical protein [Geopsychrobacter electrodiphilus]